MFRIYPVCYSKYNKKRIESLGSTISISGLPKIKKNELQPGDIGLRNGTGSLYFDADGKSYSEPGMAQDANESKEKSFDKKIKARKTKKTQLKDRIEEKKDKISEYKDKITALNGKKDEVIGLYLNQRFHLTMTSSRRKYQRRRRNNKTNSKELTNKKRIMRK